MMQPCASAARLLGGGPILSLGGEAMVVARVTATSDRLGAASHESDDAELVFAPKLFALSSYSFGSSSHRRTHDGAGRQLPGCHIAPQGDQQLACQSHDHG